MRFVVYAAVAIGAIAGVLGCAGMLIWGLSMWLHLWWEVRPTWLGFLGYFSPIIVPLFAIIAWGAIAAYKEFIE